MAWDSVSNDFAFSVMWLVLSVLIALPVLVLAFLSLVRYRRVRAEMHTPFILLKIAWCCAMVGCALDIVLYATRLHLRTIDDEFRTVLRVAHYAGSLSIFWFSVAIAVIISMLFEFGLGLRVLCDLTGRAYHSVRVLGVAISLALGIMSAIMFGWSMTCAPWGAQRDAVYLSGVSIGTAPLPGTLRDGCQDYERVATAFDVVRFLGCISIAASSLFAVFKCGSQLPVLCRRLSIMTVLALLSASFTLFSHLMMGRSQSRPLWYNFLEILFNVITTVAILALQTTLLQLAPTIWIPVDIMTRDGCTLKDPVFV